MAVSLRCSLIQFHSRSESKSICCVCFVLSCGCRRASLPDLALVITECKLDMEIVLPPLQENLKPTSKHIYTKIWRFYTVVIISVLCDWCQIKIPAHLFPLLIPVSVCLHRHCDALTFPFLPCGLMLLIQMLVGAGLCDLESCRTWLRVDLSELLALAEPIVLHSITGGGECCSGSMILSVFFLSPWGSVSTFFFFLKPIFFSHECQIIVY